MTVSAIPPLYMNVYKSGHGRVVFDSLAEAGACAALGRIGVVELKETERATTEQANEQHE